MHVSTGRILRPAGLGALCAGLLSLLSVPAASAHHGAHAAPAAVRADLHGLRLADSGPCRGGYEMLFTGRCTHGPDPAPPPELEARARAAGAAGGPIPLGVPAERVQCDGAGTSGKRVQVLYVRANNVASNLSANEATFRQTVGAADRIYRASAAKTFGARHVRWVHSTGCVVTIEEVTVQPGDLVDIVTTSAAVAAKGYDLTDRKYLMFVDSAVYSCAIGDLYYDDDDETSNLNNGGPMYSRVDRACWGSGTAASHELMHNFGGVQLTAPNSSGGGHCTDENDRMCYSDPPDFPAMTIVCPLSTDESLFDCGDDDYFNTSPNQNSYLDTHWNAADNDFLVEQVSGLWGFVQATHPSWSLDTPDVGRNQASSNQPGVHMGQAPGDYELLFTNLAHYDGTSGIAHVTALGGNGESCNVVLENAVGADESLDIRCYAANGVAANVSYSATYARPISTPGDYAHVWASSPTSASYTPNSTYSFNSTGGANHIDRTGTGAYKVKLPGLIADGGTVKVTNRGSTGNVCKVNRFGPSGADQVVRVRCFDNAGVAADTPFNLTYARRVSILGTSADSGYVWADHPALAWYTPNTTYRYNSTGGANTVTRTGTGLYTVDMPGLGSSLVPGVNHGNVQVTAYDTSSKQCQVLGWRSVAGGGVSWTLKADVACQTAFGAAADSQFILQFTK